MPQQQIPCPGYSTHGALNRIFWTGDVFGNSNYQQGGYNLTAASFGMSGFESFDVQSYSNNGMTYVMQVDYGNNAGNAEQQANTPKTVLVKFFYQANSVEVANATNLAAFCWRCQVQGV